MRYRIDVRPGHPQFAQLLCACNRERTPAEEYADRFARSGLNEREAAYTLAQVLDRPARQRAKAEAQAALARGGGWLTLHGAPGSGKSYVGCAIANAALATGKTVVYHLMPLFLDEIKRAFGTDADAEIYTRALGAGVLVIDEFEKFYATDWARERFTTLFLQRYRMASSAITVWITNQEPGSVAGPNLARPELAAFFSRMTEFPIIHMNDGDIRPAIASRRAQKA